MSLRRSSIATLGVLVLSVVAGEVRGEDGPAVSPPGYEFKAGTSHTLGAARAGGPSEGVEQAQRRTNASGLLPMSPMPSSLAPRGRVGYDDQGRPGHIHTVSLADTLWDISELYLATPWVWPSVWLDNQRIENPHLIFPGDRIWISAYEMRRVTEDEAASLLANTPETTQPVAAQDPVSGEVASEMSRTVVPDEGRVLRVSSRETSGLVTRKELESSASIVATVPDRQLLAQQDEVYVGLGEGESEVGQAFNIVRREDEVRDPDSGELLGYHVAILGWLEIESVFPETSLATIRMSTGEIELEDRLIPRRPLPPRIPLQSSPGDVEGKISFFPHERVLMGFNDFVYLNRGSLDGLEVGSPLEVYRLGFTASETSRNNERVAVPDRRIARMVVVRADSRASVALVTTTDSELEIGDRFRGER